MSSRLFATLSAIILSLMLFQPTNSYSQVIEPTGTSQEASSQLIYYYNLVQGNNDIQVTNTNDTTGVTVHVQVFRSFDADGSGGAPPTICDERDFIDFLTPNDTHVYNLNDSGFAKNTGEAEGVAGESTSIDLSSPPTEGFVIITPVVSESDLTAISFQHLIGSSNNLGIYSFNAMGRAAVDFTTGDVLEDGTPLDGTTNGFVLLQPQELIFSFESGSGPVSDIVGITFTDNYGPEGLQGYSVTPGSSTWTPFIFDWKESPTSCGDTEVACYTTVGLHDDITHYSQSNFGPGLLCAGASTPTHPVPSLSGLEIGWTRIFVSGLDEFENQLGLTFFSSPNLDAKWMNTNK